MAWPSPSLLISYFVWVIAAPGNNEVANQFLYCLFGVVMFISTEILQI